MSRRSRPPLARWSRRRRLTTALIALLHLMFMQLAVAAYRCPMETAMPANLPCAEPMQASAMDPELPNLCQAYCLAGAQANNTVEPGWMPLLAVAAPSLPPAVLASAGSSIVRRHRSWHPPPAAPPLSIQHCCWRI